MTGRRSMQPFFRKGDYAIGSGGLRRVKETCNEVGKNLDRQSTTSALRTGRIPDDDERLAARAKGATTR